MEFRFVQVFKQPKRLQVAIAGKLFTFLKIVQYPYIVGICEN